MDKFTRAYIECALWSSCDEHDEPMDANYSAEDIHADTLAAMVRDCAEFQSNNAELLSDIDSSQAGHDFWLTRNHHGAGFWDRGLGEVGEELTKAAHAYGEFDLYVGDDGLIYG